MTKNDHGRGDRQWEADLHSRSMAGDQSATGELYETHAAAIAKLAIQFAERSAWDADEAISAAREVFLDFLPKFDPSRARLITALYIVIPLRLQAYRNKDQTIAAPASYYDEGHHLRDKVDATRNVASFDYTDSDGTATLVAEDTATAVADEIDRRETSQRLQEAIRRLPGREQQIINCRTYQEMTLADIGKRIGLTKERVRQLESQAHRRLADMMAKPHLLTTKPQKQKKPTARPASEKMEPATKAEKPPGPAPQVVTTTPVSEPSGASDASVVELLAVLDRISASDLRAAVVRLDDEHKSREREYERARRRLEAIADLAGVELQKLPDNGRVGTIAPESDKPKRGTRARQLYDYLESHGPTTAKEIAAAIGATPAAVGTALSTGKWFCVNLANLWRLVDRPAKDESV